MELWHAGLSIFNAVFTWNRTSHKWNALARPYNSWEHAQLCGVPISRRFNDSSVYYYTQDAKDPEATYVSVPMPPRNVRCVRNGEAKMVYLRGQLHLYGTTHKQCPFKQMASAVPSSLAKTFLASKYLNWVVPFPAQRRSSATIIHWAIPPEPGNPTAKNFVFFSLRAQRQEQYVITLMEPQHVVYRMQQSGLISPAYSTPTAFGLPTGMRTSLSAGTVSAGAGRKLVLAHVSLGGWVGAYRKAFFYAFSTEAPFAVQCVTPIFDLGVSKELEYPMHMERHGAFLYVSVGVDNCWSAMVRLPLASVMAACEKLSQPGRRKKHLVRVQRNGTLEYLPGSFPPIWTGDRKDGKRRLPNKRGKRGEYVYLDCAGAFCPSKQSRKRMQSPPSEWPLERKSGGSGRDPPASEQTLAGGPRARGW